MFNKVVKKIFILFILISSSCFSSPRKSYEKAVKQLLLEYTVFGVDECIEKNIDKISFEKESRIEGMVLPGSKEYFSLLSDCFSNHIEKCKGDCITKSSMKKRLENIQRIKKLLNTNVKRVKPGDKI